MKKVFAAVLAMGLPAFAQASIDLKPGTSIVINGQLIRCEGSPEEQLPLCAVKKDGGNFKVYAGPDLVNSYWDFNEALNAVSQLRQAGICR